MTTLLSDFARLLDHDPSRRPRRVVTRGGIRVRGIFPSQRFQKALHWESDLERRLIYRLEASWRVQDVCTQPLTVSIPCVDGSRFRLHTGRSHERRTRVHRLYRVQTQLPVGERKPSSSVVTYRQAFQFGGHLVLRGGRTSSFGYIRGSKQFADRQSASRPRQRTRAACHPCRGRRSPPVQLPAAAGADGYAKSNGSDRPWHPLCRSCSTTAAWLQIERAPRGGL